MPSSPNAPSLMGVGGVLLVRRALSEDRRRFPWRLSGAALLIHGGPVLALLAGVLATGMTAAVVGAPPASLFGLR